MHLRSATNVPKIALHRAPTLIDTRKWYLEGKRHFPYFAALCIQD